MAVQYGKSDVIKMELEYTAECITTQLHWVTGPEGEVYALSYKDSTQTGEEYAYLGIIYQVKPDGKWLWWRSRDMKERMLDWHLVIRHLMFLLNVEEEMDDDDCFEDNIGCYSGQFFGTKEDAIRNVVQMYNG